MYVSLDGWSNKDYLKDFYAFIVEFEQNEIFDSEMTLTKHTGLNEFDGVLGLAPACDREIESVSGMIKQSDMNFLRSLKEQGMIDNESFRLKLNDRMPEIVFGEDMNAKYAGWIYSYKLPLASEDGCDWAVKLSGVSYGTNNISDFREDYSTVLDSGYAMIMLQTELYQKFREDLKESVPELDCSGYFCYSYLYQCDELTPRMKALTFQLGTDLDDKYFTLKPEGYTTSKFGQKEAKCVVAVSFLEGETVLGTPFLKAFESSFDVEDSQVILSVANANRGAVHDLPLVDDSEESEVLTPLEISLISVLCAIIFLIACHYVFEVKENRKRRQQEREIAATLKENTWCSTGLEGSQLQPNTQTQS